MSLSRIAFQHHRCDAVYLDCSASNEGFYRKCGFRRIGLQARMDRHKWLAAGRAATYKTKFFFPAAKKNGNHIACDDEKKTHEEEEESEAMIMSAGDHFRSLFTAFSVFTLDDRTDPAEGMLGVRGGIDHNDENNKVQIDIPLRRQVARQQLRALLLNNQATQPSHLCFEGAQNQQEHNKQQHPQQQQPKKLCLHHVVAAARRKRTRGTEEEEEEEDSESNIVILGVAVVAQEPKYIHECAHVGHLHFSLLPTERALRPTVTAAPSSSSASMMHVTNDDNDNGGASNVTTQTSSRGIGGGGGEEAVPPDDVDPKAKAAPPLVISPHIERHIQVAVAAQLVDVIIADIATACYKFITPVADDATCDDYYMRVSSSGPSPAVVGAAIAKEEAEAADSSSSSGGGVRRSEQSESSTSMRDILLALGFDVDAGVHMGCFAS